MYLFSDELYKDEDGKYYTKEYCEHQGKIVTENGKKYYVVGQLRKKIVSEKNNTNIRDELFDLYESGGVIMCNYAQLFREFDNMVLCNSIWDLPAVRDCSTLENGTDYDEEDDTYAEVFQWYIIDDALADSLSRHTDEIIYYCSLLDVYILGVTHFGTAWDYVAAEYKM